MPMRYYIIILSIFTAGCLKPPTHIKPVENFNLERYLGKWYEIARLNHSFERGLQKVSAEYSLRDDGGVEVINKGYLPQEKKWKQARGKAYFVDTPDTGFLKVSFFGPFYGAYVIFELDKQDYSYAFVSGSDRKYLWLLSRNRNPGKKVINHFIETSKKLGYDTDNLIFVDQSP